MASEFRITRRVEFAETDMAGIVHFSNFFRYMESCEHAFFRSLGFSIHPHDPTPEMDIGWPRVRATCDYRAPLRFEDEFTIQLTVTERRNKSLSYRFQFYHGPTVVGDPIATGEMTVVCVRREPDTGRMRAATIPDPIAQAITVAL